MNLKSLNVKNKTHKKVLSYLKDKKIFRIFKEFEKSVNTKNKLAVAVSGGPDSLALTFLTKCFSSVHKLDVKYFLVDHKLRKESSLEAKKAKNILKKIGVNCKILTWHGKKPLTNIQSVARNKRYLLLVDECKKNNINNILLGHHLDDLFENFFIRLLRGSGLNGLISLSKSVKYKDNDIKIIRPLLNIEKKNLIYLSRKIFNSFIEDPSNKNQNFKRIRIRKLLNSFSEEGLDKKKFLLTINNLKDSDQSIKFYVNKNIRKNTTFFLKKNIFILNKNFFDQSHEVIFRSLTKIIQIIGKKNYPIRGKSLSGLVKKINYDSFTKTTLGHCFIEKVNKSILISKES